MSVLTNQRPRSREELIIKWLLFDDHQYVSIGTPFGVDVAGFEATRQRFSTPAEEQAVVELIAEASPFTSINACYLKGRHFDVVTHLIDCHKFDPQHQDSDGSNLLHIACIVFLKELSKPVRARHVELQSRIYHEAGSKLKEIIEYAIEKCYCDPQTKNCKGALPLHIACCSELVPLEVVELLSNCGVNTGLSSEWDFDRITKLTQGDTPLHVACLNGSEEMVKYLIEKCHCDPRITNSKGALALHAACARRSLSIVRMVSDCDVNTGLTSACRWEVPSITFLEGDTPLLFCRYDSEISYRGISLYPKNK